MTRDIEERIGNFLWHDVGSYSEGFNLERIALNMDQIRQFGPPPNPAKLTDSRGRGYVELHGYESWELDALNPKILSDLVRENVTPLIDQDLWDEKQQREETERAQLELIVGKWDRVVEFLEEDAA